DQVGRSGRVALAEQRFTSGNRDAHLSLLPARAALPPPIPSPSGGGNAARAGSILPARAGLNCGGGPGLRASVVRRAGARTAGSLEDGRRRLARRRREGAAGDIALAESAGADAGTGTAVLAGLAGRRQDIQAAGAATGCVDHHARN